MVLPFLFPALLILFVAGREKAKEPSGGNVLRLIQIRLATPSMQKISLTCQENWPRFRIADSSSIKAVSFSSARTTKRFPSSRWRFVTTKQCNELRGATIHGDLPWRDLHEISTASINRVSAPVSARSLLPKSFNPESSTCPREKCTHEICSRKDRRGVDLISDALPYGRLWYGEPDATSNAIECAKFRNRSHRDPSEFAGDQLPAAPICALFLCARALPR
jgi:hypothetical protein